MTPLEHPITRRTMLRVAAGGAAAIATQSLPAWARPVRHHAKLRRPDSLPFPHLPAGTPSMHEIKHIVVLIMENHSFDSFFGSRPPRAPRPPGRRRSDVPQGSLLQRQSRRGRRTLSGDPRRHPVPGREGAEQFLECQPRVLETTAATTASSRRAGRSRCGTGTTTTCRSHTPWRSTSRSATASSARSSARPTPTGASSSPAPRRHDVTDTTTFTIPAANGTIWDRLDAHKIDWGNYYSDLPSWLIVPGSATPARAGTGQAVRPILRRRGGRPAAGVHVPGPELHHQSQENPQDMQVGEEFVAGVVGRSWTRRSWKHTALFITYDEHGGYYDHVPPPRAIKPDSIPPILRPGDAPGGYARYGFRVPPDRGLTVGEARTTSRNAPGPDLDHGVHRAQVEPAGDDVP